MAMPMTYNYFIGTYRRNANRGSCNSNFTHHIDKLMSLSYEIIVKILNDTAIDFTCMEVYSKLRFRSLIVKTQNRIIHGSPYI